MNENSFEPMLTEMSRCRLQNIQTVDFKTLHSAHLSGLNVLARHTERKKTFPAWSPFVG